MTTKSAVKRKKRSTEVDVDWQVEKKCNAERARYMFEMSIYCDCEFLVGNEDEKEVICKLFRNVLSISNFCLLQLVKGHKIFLAMGSPVFEAMFYGEMAQANAGRSRGSEAMEVLDVQPAAFKELLESVIHF